MSEFSFTEWPFFGSNQVINAHLSKAAAKLSPKLKRIHEKLGKLGVSKYSQCYMSTVFGTPFRRNYNLIKYAHILSNALEAYTFEQLKHLTLVDYGGGHGVLSLLAKEAGIGTVIHSDICHTSSRDAQIIAHAAGARASYFFLGDTDDFKQRMDFFGLKADIIVNYDVLEHVYNLRQYFLDLSASTKPGGQWFMGSGANLYNKAQLDKLLTIHENLEGTLTDENANAYVKQRASIIREYKTELLPEEVDALAKATRGWRKEDIHRAVDLYFSSGHIVEFCPPRNNTADPRNGNWGENILPIEAYSENPILKNVTESIEIVGSAEWAVFDEDTEQNRLAQQQFKKLSNMSPRDALCEAPYYCLKAKLLD